MIFSIPKCDVCGKDYKDQGAFIFPTYEPSCKCYTPACGPWLPMSEAPKDGTWILAMYDNSFKRSFAVVRRHESHPVWVTNEHYEKCEGWNNDSDFTHFALINKPEVGK